MTKEEAIKTIENAKHFAYDESYIQAFNMAIEALGSEVEAKWIEDKIAAENGESWAGYYCSNCGGYGYGEKRCSNCFARMKVKKYKTNVKEGEEW